MPGRERGGRSRWRRGVAAKPACGPSEQDGRARRIRSCANHAASVLKAARAPAGRAAGVACTRPVAAAASNAASRVWQTCGKVCSCPQLKRSRPLSGCPAKRRRCSAEALVRIVNAGRRHVCVRAGQRGRPTSCGRRRLPPPPASVLPSVAAADCALVALPWQAVPEQQDCLQTWRS